MLAEQSRAGRSAFRDAGGAGLARGRTVVIQKNWQELIKPNKLQVTTGDDPKRVATVVAEPVVDPGMTRIRR